MSKQILILTGDKRQLYIYKYLVSHLDNQLFHITFSDLPNDILAFDYIICNTPFRDNDIIDKVASSQTFIGLNLSSKLKFSLSSNYVKYIDIYDEIKAENGRLTAEGLLSYIISTTPFSLKHRKCLITGFGACGTNIAWMLKSFGANVSVYDKSVSQRANALSCGYKLEYHIYLKKLVNYDIVINTIPENIIFDNEHFDYGKLNNCYIYDIASYPYGFEHKTFSRLKNKYIYSGIPGLIMPESAGILAAKIIERKLSDEI